MLLLVLGLSLAYFGAGCVAAYWAAYQNPVHFSRHSNDRRIVDNGIELLGLALIWPGVIPYQVIQWSASRGLLRADRAAAQRQLTAEVDRARKRAFAELSKEVEIEKAQYQDLLARARAEVETLLNQPVSPEVRSLPPAHSTETRR